MRRRAKSLLRWFVPGLGVKRWFLVLLAGTTLGGVGLALFLLDIYREAPQTWWLPAITFISLQFLTRDLRMLVFGGLGLGLIVLGSLGHEPGPAAAFPPARTAAGGPGVRFPPAGTRPARGGHRRRAWDRNGAARAERVYP